MRTVVTSHNFDDKGGDKGGGRILEIISSLRKVVNHPHIFFQFYAKCGGPEKYLSSSAATHGSIRQLSLSSVAEFQQFMSLRGSMLGDEDARLAYRFAN